MTAADGSATPDAQRAAIAAAMDSVAGLIAAGHEVVITHGNGPQVGNLLVKNELAAAVGASRPVAAIVTRTRVDENDPGFTRPTKPVGRFLPYEQAKPLIEHGQL